MKPPRNKTNAASGRNPPRLTAAGVIRAEGEGLLPRTGDPVEVSFFADRFGYNLRRTYVAVLSDLARLFAPFDISPRQFGILAVVGRNPGLSQGRVSAAVGVARTNFVAMLDALEKRGFVKRQTVQNDRRSYALHLTAKGENILETLHAIDIEHEQKMRNLLGDQDAKRLLNLLAKLRGAVSK